MFVGATLFPLKIPFGSENTTFKSDRASCCSLCRKYYRLDVVTWWGIKEPNFDPGCFLMQWTMINLYFYPMSQCPFIPLLKAMHLDNGEGSFIAGCLIELCYWAVTTNQPEKPICPFLSSLNIIFLPFILALNWFANFCPQNKVSLSIAIYMPSAAVEWITGHRPTAYKAVSSSLNCQVTARWWPRWWPIYQ